MEQFFYTLQDFMFHAESNTYILLFFILLGILGFWGFLSARDDD